MQDVSVAETIVEWEPINFQTTIFHCSKYYGSVTRVTMLKVAPNMVYATSMKQSVSSLDKSNTLNKTICLNLPHNGCGNSCEIIVSNSNYY